MAGDFKRAREECAKHRNDKKKPDKTKSFAHDGKNRIVDGFWQIASGLDGITDAYASKAASADGQHSVFDMISGIGAGPAGKSSHPSIHPAHAVTRHSYRATRDNNHRNKN